MKRIQKIKISLLLFGACLAVCWIFVLQYGIFGSDLDWVNQHSVLPDYFRQRFYDTGQLFPDIAWNLGAGQNIYNFSYYGLFNPIIWISYLLPFVPMSVYIQITSILSYGASVVIFYCWLKKKWNHRITLACTFLFLLAAPLVYHSYNQLMFVNYMPFLCAAFFGVDKYIEEKKKALLLCSVCGMVLTSFFFSIGGLLALGIYGASKFTEKGIKEFFKNSVSLAGVLLHGVLFCGILLIPTAFVLLDRGGGGSQAEMAVSLFTAQPMRFLYTPHGVGLSALALIALFDDIICRKKWQEKFLPVSLFLIFTIPLVGYVLNGGLYDKGKVFIPFLPLMCMEVAKYIDCIKKRKRTFRDILPYLITAIFLIAGKTFWALLDCGVMLLCFLIKKKFSAFPLAVWVSCVILFCSGWAINKGSNHIIPKEDYEKILDRDTKAEVEEILDKDADWYRMEEQQGGKKELQDINRIEDSRQLITSVYSSAYNEEYDKFRRETFDINEHFRNTMMQAVSDNPLFLQLMGVKYVIGKNPLAGYELLEEGKNGNLYVNSHAAPIGYVTNEVVSEKSYQTLDFPVNQTAFLWKAVTKSAEGDADFPAMNTYPLEIPEINEEENQIKKTSSGWSFSLSKEEKISIPIKDIPVTEDLLSVRFQVKNKKDKDMYIRLCGQTNRLTAKSHEYANHNESFAYTVTLNQEKQTADFVFGSGEYEISNLEVFTGNLRELSNEKLYETPLKLEKIEGDTLVCSVDNKEAGYLITSIPYDEGFEIRLNGEKISMEKVNTAFLGAKVPKGRYTVEISYQAQGKKLGFVCTGVGILLLLGGKIRCNKKGRMIQY